MGVPVPTITCEGVTLDPTVEVLDLEVRRELNRVPEARLTLLDGSVARRRFELSDQALFEPGKRVRVAMRHEGDTEDVPLFEGLVVRHAVEARADGTRLRVDLKDPAFKLTRPRRSAVFRDQTDDEVARGLIEGAGLTAGELASTAVRHRELVQYQATDWDFLLSRADVLGLVVRVHLGAVSLLPLALGAAVRVLDLGLDDVSDLALELDATGQWAELSGAGWDPQGRTRGQPEPAAEPSVPVGNLDAAAIARQLGGAACALLHPAALEPGEARAWADARLLRSRLALLRGRATVDGDAALAPLDTVEIQGVGDRFNGAALVSGVTQRYGAQGWKTELQLGLSPEWFARRPDIAEVPAGGMVPPVRGLQIATVAPFEADPLGEQRIKVRLPALDEPQGFVWARLARPDAGPERGLVFWPEPDDEVVLGFLDEDPRQAVVLGALHGSATAPPPSTGGPSETNPKRAIVSRAGTTILFDDDGPSVTIDTPSGREDGQNNRIVIDEGAATITIQDQHGNQITLGSGGISLVSVADLTLEASGKLTLKGSAVDVQ